MQNSNRPSLLSHRAMATRKAARLQPPSGITEDQHAIWNMTVQSLPPDWFATEQMPILTAYCRHVCRADQLEAALAQLDPIKDQDAYDKLTKLAAGESAKIAMHARSMRLTQQARYKAETAHGHAGAAAWAASRKHDDDDPEGLLA
jgi:hypothetical protein